MALFLGAKIKSIFMKIKCKNVDNMYYNYDREQQLSSI